jgi:hypothetical protein
MNRLFTTAVSVLGLTVASAGTALASCPAPGGPADPAPAKPPLHYIDDTFKIPAGTACKDTVVLRQRGHVRDPYTVTRHGKEYIIFESGKDLRMTLRNPRTGRSVSKDISGTFIDHLVKGGRDSKSIGLGANVFSGKGIKGILWAKGYQRFYVKNYFTEKQKITIQVTRGKTVELCGKVGSKPVNGKNLPAPEEPPAS